MSDAAFIIRCISLEDINVLTKLNENNIPEHYPKAIWDVHATVFRNICFIAIVKGIPVGYILCIYDKVDIRQPHCLITSFVVDKEYRRHGIGEKLLQVCVEKANLHYSDIRYISLNVRKSNYAAIDLYRKQGFKEIGTLTKYYEDGEDAYEMRK